MQVLKNISETRSWRSRLSRTDGSLGLVPTMGALHDGHLSLIRRCRVENKICATSIFVNPTQFNDPEDFKNYPRSLERDLDILRKLSCDMVFTPATIEMYPEKDDRVFDFGELDKTMEGSFRPGHFNGVAQIVSKLFALINPDKAYFGEKDFQQLIIIRALVEKLNLHVEVIGSPIVREPDGLAMSSRNQLLSNKERKAAARIYRTLSEAAGMKSKPGLDELKKQVIRRVNAEPLLQVEYFEIVDEQDLGPVRSWHETTRLRACIAVRCGQVRLIDNINISY